jgi:hypothetical protein
MHEIITSKLICEIAASRRQFCGLFGVRDEKKIDDELLHGEILLGDIKVYYLGRAVEKQ